MAHSADLRLDLANAAVRANIVAECARYVSATVPGRYVRGSRRAFDGIMIDIEPAGDSVLFGSLKTLMTELRASFDRMGLKGKKIGVTAPQHTLKMPKPNWGWNSSGYHYMARYVDYVVAMTYDSGLRTSEYQSWIAEQTTHILQAVSGAAWRFDANHPKPTNGVRLLIGLPGFYTRTRAHDPDIENVPHGAPDILQALSQLHSNDRTSLGYFQGAERLIAFTHDMIRIGGGGGNTGSATGFNAPARPPQHRPKTRIGSARHLLHESFHELDAAFERIITRRSA